MKITNEILEGYLNCKSKGHLKLAGEGGTKSDLEVMTSAAKLSSQEAALARLNVRFGKGDAGRGEDGSFVYLLGVLVTEGDAQTSPFFWADPADQEAEALDAFLELLDGREDFTLFLEFLLSQEEDVEAFCQRGRRKNPPPTIEVYPKGYSRRGRKRPRDHDDTNRGGQGERIGRWRPAVLAYLRDRAESGASFHDIADHCVGLIRGGTLVTSVSADDRRCVDQNLAQFLNQGFPRF